MTEMFKNITPKNIIFFIIALLFLVFITQIKDIAILFFASYVISCSLNPLVDKLEKKNMKRSFASSLVLLGVLLVVALFLIPIIIMGGYQIKSFLQVLPNHIETFRNFILNLPMLENAHLKDLNITDIFCSASEFTSNFVTSSILVGKGVVASVVYTLAACIIIYYFMADKDVVKNAYLSLFPNSLKEKAEDIMNSISQKIGGYVVAQIVTMTCVGLIVMLGLMILKVDYAVILGLLTAIFDIVPIVGPAIALVIILLAIYKLGILKIGLVIFIFAFAQWAENNLVRPYVFSKFLNIHPLIIYLFLFITAQYLGIIGVIFAPAIAATVCVLIEELYIKSIN